MFPSRAYVGSKKLGVGDLESEPVKIIRGLWPTIPVIEEGTLGDECRNERHAIVLYGRAPLTL
jgi:hypothetical protein